MKIDKAKVDIVAFSDEYKTIGTAHVFSSGRFSDFIDNLQKGYINITNAKVYSVRTNKLLYETKFMKLNLVYIMAIMPVADFIDKSGEKPKDGGLYTIE